MAREDRQELEATIDELKNQITELTTKLESGALALKSFSDVCTFRAADFHTLINDIRQQQRDQSTSLSIEPVAPPPPVADTHHNTIVQPSTAHEQGGLPSAPSLQVPTVPPSHPSTRINLSTGISAKPAFKSLVPRESSLHPRPEDLKVFLSLLLHLAAA